MRKVYEDLLAEELAEVIDLYYDSKSIEFDEEIELESELFITTKGTIDYTHRREDDTNSVYITWIDVNIYSIEIAQYRDGEQITPTIQHLNPNFVEKYLEQYLMNRS